MKQLQESNNKIYSLLTLKTNKTQRKFVFIIASILCLITLLSTPFVQVQLPQINAYQPAIYSTVICFELITAYILYSQFVVSGSISVIFLSASYLFSSGMNLAYLLTFPGVFSQNGMFHAGLQTSPWLYLILHLGFPLFILMYLIFDGKFIELKLSKSKIKLISILMLISILFIVFGLLFITTYFHDFLPIVLKNGMLTSFFKFKVGMLTLIINLFVFLGFYRRTKGRTVTSAWLCVAILASFLDVLTVLYGGKRFSLGWYVSKWNTFICANILLTGMIYEFTKMYLKMTELYKKVAESENKFRDLFSASQLAEMKIVEQNKIIERMLELSHEAIVMCDINGRVVFSNKRFENLFHRPIFDGEKLSNYYKQKNTYSPELSEQIERYFEKQYEPFQERISIIMANDITLIFKCYASPIIDESSGILHGHLFCFGDRTAEEHMANYDELTGLPNRRFILNKITESLKNAEYYSTKRSILFIDLDGFKLVNDTYGHEIGDKLLIEVSTNLQKIVNNKGICARLAGDELIVLLENQEAIYQQEKMVLDIINSIQSIQFTDGCKINVTASVGIASFPTDGNDANTLLKRADRAMYEAKKNGKNNFKFYSESTNTEYVNFYI